MKNCKNCKKEFEKKYHDSKNYWAKKIFCSSFCSGTFNKPAKKLVGRKRPLEVIEKCKPTMFKKGQKAWNKGLKGFNAGEKSPNWKGGVSKSPYFIAFRQARRNIRKLGNGGSHTMADWETLKAQYNWTCLACKKQEPQIRLTQDHIIPITKGGSDNIENIQPLCRSCNSRKRVETTNYRIVEL